MWYLLSMVFYYVTRHPVNPLSLEKFSHRSLIHPPQASSQCRMPIWLTLQWPRPKVRVRPILSISPDCPRDTPIRTQNVISGLVPYRPLIHISPHWAMATSCIGLSIELVRVCSIFLTTSMPSITLPKTTCLLLRWGVAVVVMKN